MAPRTGLHPGSELVCLPPPPPRETVEQLGSVKPAGFHASAARDGYLQGLDKAEATPPGPTRPPRPRATRTAASHQSSLTSLEGSGISEHPPQKSLHQAGGPHLEVSICMGHGSPGDFCPRAFAHTLPEGLLLPIPVSYSSAQHSGLMPSAASLGWGSPYPCCPARSSCLSSKSLWPIVCISLSLISAGGGGGEGQSLTPFDSMACL